MQLDPLDNFLRQWLRVSDNLDRWQFFLPVLPLKGGERNFFPPISYAQFIKTAITCHLKQPALERNIRHQYWQGYIDLEEDMLEHIIVLLAVFDKAMYI